MKETIQTYLNPAGAQAFIAKEIPHDADRSTQAWQLLDGLDLHGKIVLDMGCGFGRDTAEIRRRGAACWGIDVSPHLLQEARLRYGGSQWHEADVLDLHNPPIQPVDLIWSYAFLVHVPHTTVEALLTRWAGWLKPGGRIVIGTKVGSGQKVVNNLGQDLPRTMVYHSLADIQAILERCGGKVEVAHQDAATAYGEALLLLRTCHP